ncbi:hypothetical protein JCM8115_005680 [Rhodotorula mucilaginosa]|uniref:Uncharacterized protein n=1 Tax=Rhodotorula mucilaginosa TaxID=5537 RepID=A0A9P6W3T5_RHOMI|nr:hypothetical protein C6P46_003811 [Rhodotorula mucilaginosa]TKA51902.1 hypothetical protein B0A53_04932 [Rhodotorula sp. CCFEE 5036]
MDRSETNEVDVIDEALASGELIKARLVDPTDELKAVFKSMGRTKTNFIYEEEFVDQRPLAGAMVASERWQQQTILFPLCKMTIGTINCLTRILDDDLKSNMPGLDTCSEAGKNYWRDQFQRAEKEGTYDEEEATKARTDLDPQILEILVQCLFRDELSIYCFASSMYDRAAVDARRPVEQGDEHTISLEELAEHLRSQITRIVKADTRRQALVELESVTTDEKVWLEKVQKASDRAAAANSSKLAATTDANKLAATTDANKLENSYPRERHRSA